MEPYLLLAFYSLLIVLGSLFGGWLPTRYVISHTRMQVILSYVGGLMLGIGLLHMLPHGFAVCGSLETVITATMVGLLFMFFLIRAFHFHQHGAAQAGEEGHDDCDHDHSHGVHHDHGVVHELSWTGVAIGLMVHTLIDGLALGAAVLTDFSHNPIPSMWGFGVFLAIVLHKPLDALSITSLMSASGWSGKSQATMNLVFSLMCPVGAIAFALGMTQLGPSQTRILGMALGFSAGTFLCISLSDLLPEVQFHKHDRVKLSAALLLGVLTAYGVGLLEPAHLHGKDRGGAMEGTESGAPVEVIEPVDIKSGEADAPAL